MATAIEEQKGNMPNAVPGGKALPPTLPDIGHKILDRTVFEFGNCGSGLPLQGSATRALRVVNLHDCRNAVSEERKVALRDAGLDISYDVPTTTS